MSELAKAHAEIERLNRIVNSGDTLRDHAIRKAMQERDGALTRLAEAERDADQLLKERDEAEAMADKLADAIATLTGADIGEHSYGNCPWHAALEAAEEHRAADSAREDGSHE